MFQRFITLVVVLVLCACSNGESEEKSKADFESKLLVSHSYDLVNPYAKTSEGARLIIDLPYKNESHQMLFDIDVPENSTIFEREGGEQYLEVSLGNMSAKQETSITLSYSLAQNSRSSLSTTDAYESIFPEMQHVIDFPEKSDITFESLKNKVLENWIALSALLPPELKDTKEDLDLIQNIVAADLLLLKSAGEILIGFTCDSNSQCNVKDYALWLDYMEGEELRSIFLNQSVLNDNRIAVKGVSKPKQIIDFLQDSIGVEGVGVLVSIN